MLQEIRAAIIAGHYNVGPHAGLRQFERGITTQDVERAIGGNDPEVIETYPDDPRGASCLIRGEGPDGQILHAVCKPNDPVFIVTCYHPNPELWYPGFRKRK